MLTAQRSRDLRDRIEEELRVAVQAALRDFLADVKRASLSGLRQSPSVITAAAPEPISNLPSGLPTLGQHAGRWTASVDAHVMSRIQDAFGAVYDQYRDSGMSSATLAAQEAYLERVRDRLVLGTHFGVPVYDDSFDAVRVALARGTEEGWSREALSQRIAAALDWETDGSYWRSVLSDVDSKIDAILDPLGRPGSPAREYARLNDPRVQALRDERNLAIKHLDSEKSLWQTRADLIARTEATGVANYGALAALADEGWTHKEWVSTIDQRTRPEHADVNGIVVELAQPFDVGGFQMHFPGDPAGPASMVVNCRCTMIGSDG